MRGSPPLLLALLAMTVFAGCVGSAGSGLAAQDAAATMDGAAHAWAEDAALLAIYGIENAAHAAVAGTANLTAGDHHVGDGQLPAWAAIYYSPAKGELQAFVVDAAGARAADLGGRSLGHLHPTTVEAAIANAGRWSIDSTQAIAKVRAADSTLDAAFDADPVVASVQYSLDLYDDVQWEIGGVLGDVRFYAHVDFVSGNVTSVQVGTDLELPSLPGGETDAPLPPPIHKEGMTPAGADPGNYLGMGVCESPTAMCEEFQFTVNASATIEASLKFSQPASDYDLYILDSDGNEVAQSAELPGEHESLSADLGPGTYTVQIVPWAVAGDTWVFDATFS